MLRLHLICFAAVFCPAACVGPGPAAAAPPDPPAGARAPARLERRLGLMGTLLRIRVTAPSRPAALAASEAAVRALEATEARLSTWRPDSELAALNAAPPGRTVSLSPELAGELAACARWSRATGGAFDPVVGALVAAWGLREGGRQPSTDALAAARAGTGLHHLQLGRATAARLHPAATLEEGAWGKGAGLDAAGRVLEEAGVQAFLDLGGQVLAVGAAATVAVADPRDRSRPVLELRLPAGRSLAVSGNSERGIRVAGRRLGHVLDPRTGRPAPDFGSLAVETAGALAADCLSTGLYVLGPDAALAWAGRHPGTEVLVVETTPDGLRVRATPDLARRLHPLIPGLAVEAVPPPKDRNLTGPST